VKDAAVRSLGIPQTRCRKAPFLARTGGAREPDEAELTRRFVLYFVLPVWLAAGVADEISPLRPIGAER
jgi:hypothetical protein